MTFLQFLITGLSLGSVYAIIALGYTMVYGIAKMLNFAHGDIIMIGAYIAYFAMGKYNLPAFVAVMVSVLVCTLLGVVVERLAYKPLRKVSSLSVLITAIGVSYFLQNGAQLLWSSSPKMFTAIIPASTIKLFDGRLTITWLSVFTIVVTLLIMIGLTVFVTRSRIGKAMRACAEDKDTARLMGINVDTTISVTFAIGSGLAAVAAALYASAYQSISPTLGSMPGIKAFTAAVFGGIGSMPGAFLGGLLLGVIETLVKGYLTTQLSDAFVFGILIIILLVKPNGLLGRKYNEKV
ncbi:MAG: branched-chain amino acid ABC transporter permease [Erysipelotrichaceae bacterium]|nr:branched-chain amino acid ABC transporter permease [Erysipelotrichaceae bacterium]MBR5049606.1 branched-chain amino acid ABC transporter permease [Erysipelotrichaceae bacterium]